MSSLGRARRIVAPFVSVLVVVVLIAPGCSDAAATEASYREAMTGLCARGAAFAQLSNAIDQEHLVALGVADEPIGDYLPQGDDTERVAGLAHELADAIDAAGVPSGADYAERGAELAKTLGDEAELLLATEDTGSREARFDSTFALIEALAAVAEVAGATGVDRCGDALPDETEEAMDAGGGDVIAGILTVAFQEDRSLPPGADMTDEQVSCLGEELADTLGTAQILAIVEDEDDAMEFVAGDYVSTFIECIDGFDEWLRSDWIATASVDGVPAEAATCLLDKLLEDQDWEDLVEYDYEADPGPIEDAIAACGGPAAL